MFSAIYSYVMGFEFWYLNKSYVRLALYLSLGVYLFFWNIFLALLIYLDDIIDVWNGFNHLLAYNVHLLDIAINASLISQLFRTVRSNIMIFLSFFLPALKFAKNRILMLN